VLPPTKQNKTKQTGGRVQHDRAGPAASRTPPWTSCTARTRYRIPGGVVASPHLIASCDIITSLHLIASYDDVITSPNLITSCDDVITSPHPHGADQLDALLPRADFVLRPSPAPWGGYSARSALCRHSVLYGGFARARLALDGPKLVVTRPAWGSDDPAHAGDRGPL
jgi:hypothetical protein